MPTVSITSNDGKLSSASAVLEVTATNPEYNQPALRVKQAGVLGGAASIRIDDPNPDIEFVETGLTGPDPGAGKFEIAVQADRLQINGRKAAVSPDRKASILLSCFSGRQRVAISVSDSRKPTSLKVWRRTGRHRDCECLGRSFSESRWRWDFVCRGRGTQVSELEWHGDSYRARLTCGLHQKGNEI